MIISRAERKPRRPRNRGNHARRLVEAVASMLSAGVSDGYYPAGLTIKAQLSPGRVAVAVWNGDKLLANTSHPVAEGVEVGKRLQGEAMRLLPAAVLAELRPREVQASAAGGA